MKFSTVLERLRHVRKKERGLYHTKNAEALSVAIGVLARLQEVAIRRQRRRSLTSALIRG